MDVIQDARSIRPVEEFLAAKCINLLLDCLAPGGESRASREGYDRIAVSLERKGQRALHPLLLNTGLHEIAKFREAHFAVIIRIGCTLDPGDDMLGQQAVFVLVLFFGGLHISAGRQIEHALTRLRAQRLTDLFGHLAFRGAVAEDAIDRATETAIEDYYAGAR